MRSSWLIACLLPAAAFAQTFNERLQEGRDRLSSGDSEGALTIYRDLLVDHPDSDALQYNIGCAQYEKALEQLRANDVEAGVMTLQEAEASFGLAQRSANAALREQAGYNRANSKAQLAKHFADTGDREHVEKAFESSIQEYETYLERYPKNADARHNLGHMRYLLKKMLQEPPPPEEQQQQDQQQQNQEQQEQDEQNEGQSGQNEGEEQQDEEEQPQPQPGEQEQQEQQEQEGQENQGQEQQTTSEQQQDAQGQQSQDVSQGEEQPATPDRQTIEAILQSLEDEDQREQKEMRSGRLDPSTMAEWW